MPRKKPDRRDLMIKIRVVPLVPMPKSELLRQVRRAIRTQIVPDTIQISYMDWEKGKGARLSDGRIEGDDLESLKRFAAAFSAADTRVERLS